MACSKFSLVVVILLLFNSRASDSTGAARIWLPQNLVSYYQRGEAAPPQRSTLQETLDRSLVGLRHLQSRLSNRRNWNNIFNESLILSKRFASSNDVTPQIAYVISPLSEQILPINSEKLLQGYRQFVPLADTYKMGLQKVSSYPVNNNELIAQRLGEEEQQSIIHGGGCRTLRSSIRLERDEVDKTSGQIIRQCRGLVQLNRCEGSCPSGVQPSIKSRSGFKKDCSCCNEATFRRVQVRLTECTSPMIAADNDQQVVLMLPDGGGNGGGGGGGSGQNNGENVANLLMGTLAQQEKSAVGQLVATDSGTMDIEVDEPIDCKCRKCDSSL